jgi:fatty acid desaturase
MTARDVGLLNDLVGQAVGDDRRYLRTTLVWSLLLYAALAAALLGLVSPLWLLVAVPLIYVRLSLALHELMHLRSAAHVPAFHRLAMILDTPFGLGYREHRVIHLRHHRSSAGPDDPELYQIAGGHARALLGALLVPERSLVSWVRTHGMSRALLRDAAFRCAVFVAVAAVDPVVFAVYWLTLRASIGAAGFIFHHLLHQRDGRLGTFSLPFSPGLLAAARQLFGEEPMLILQRHRAHHLWPSLRVRDLPDLPPGFDLPPGPPAAALHALRALAGPAGRQGTSR